MSARRSNVSLPDHVSLGIVGNALRSVNTDEPELVGSCCMSNIAANVTSCAYADAGGNRYLDGFPSEAEACGVWRIISRCRRKPWRADIHANCKQQRMRAAIASRTENTHGR